MELPFVTAAVAVVTKVLAAEANAGGPVSRSSPAVLARSLDCLDQKKCLGLFKLKAAARCFGALVREMSGGGLGNSRLLLYTEDDGKAWLLARLSEKIAKKEKRGSAATFNLRSFFAVAGDVMLDKASEWARDQLLSTGLWSEGGALAGDISVCGFSFRWGQTLEGSRHSYSDAVCASTSKFELEYNRAAVNVNTHTRLPRLVREMDTMLADLEECRGGEVWAFGDDEWLTNGKSRCAAQRVVAFVRKLRRDTHFHVPDVARLATDKILGPDARARARGIGVAYMLVVFCKGLVACSIGNRMVARGFLSELSPASSTSLRETSLSLVRSLDVNSTINTVGALTPAEVEEAIRSQELLPVFGPGYGVGVSGGKCILHLAGRQSYHPAERIFELAGSVLPDLSQRYADRATLFFGRTVVSKREARTRVVFVKDPIATTLAKTYTTTEVGGYELSSFSMLLGSLNLTYLTVSRDADMFRSWMYPTLWSDLCSTTYGAISRAQTSVFDYVSRSVLDWNQAAEGAHGPVLSTAALYMATEIIGKKVASYEGEFGCWCQALGFKRVPQVPAGIVADAPLILSECKVWKTDTEEEALTLANNGKYLTLTRGERFDHVVLDATCTPNTAIPPAEESVRLGRRLNF